MMKTKEEKISKDLNVTAEQAWEVISAVSGVDKWFGSLIKTCQVIDGKRYCETRDGAALEENILEVNDETRTFRFGIPKQDMLPVKNIIETMSVKENGSDKSTIEWSATFEAMDEHVDMAKEAFRNLWNMGLEELEQFINNKNR